MVWWGLSYFQVFHIAVTLAMIGQFSPWPAVSYQAVTLFHPPTPLVPLEASPPRDSFLSVAPHAGPLSRATVFFETSLAMRWFLRTEHSEFAPTAPWHFDLQTPSVRLSLF